MGDTYDGLLSLNFDPYRELAKACFEGFKIKFVSIFFVWLTWRGAMTKRCYGSYTYFLGYRKSVFHGSLNTIPCHAFRTESHVYFEEVSDFGDFSGHMYH